MIRKLFQLTILFLTLCLRVDAQEIRVVDGEKYIVHTVLQGQTLYGISQHYALPIDAIIEANPGASSGLAIGQVLLLPVKEQSRKQLRTAPELRAGELLHTVRKKETLYGISRKYGVTIEAIEHINPELADGLRVDMVLRIPVEGSTAAPPSAVTPAMADTTGMQHLVAAGETLYGLGKRFGVDPEAIKEANGGLAEGLKVGQYIRIPKERAIPKPSVLPSGPLDADSLAKVKHKVAFLLPFSATSSDTTGIAGENNNASVTEAAVEFYAGALLALDSLKALGFNADVHTMDTGDNAAQWGPVLASDELRGMEIYIGPFHRSAIEALTRVSGGAHIVCPVPQSNKVLLGNPTVSKALSGRPDQLGTMARYIAQHHGTENIVLCFPAIYAERGIQGLMQRELNKALSGVSTQRDSVLTVNCGRRDVTAAIAKCVAGKTNVLVVPSEDVEFVTAAVNSLGAVAAKYDLVVFGMNAWTSMANLDVEALMKIDTHLPASSFIEYTDPAVNDFLARYRGRYHNEPGEYAFLGYDVTFYYLAALMRYGATFPQHLSELQERMLHMGFRFDKAGTENGYRNEAAMMLEYKDNGIHLAP